MASLIYDALEEFYERHEPKNVPDQDSMKFALWESANPDGLHIYQKMKLSLEDERKYAGRIIQISEDGVVLGADEATHIIQTYRKFFADIQTLIDLVEAVLKGTGVVIRLLGVGPNYAVENKKNSLQFRLGFDLFDALLGDKMMSKGKPHQRIL